MTPLRALLEGERFGVLATLAAGRDGWPFASLAAYALSADSEPLLLLSDLAEHTRNVRADPRASLLVTERGEGDPLAHGRLTLLGRIAAVEAQARDSALAAYVRRHPSAADYARMADFRLYVLEPTEARFVGGFGDMGWLAGEALTRALGAQT